jgi:hypothetical protein
MKEIFLNQGKVALVDDEDYGWLMKFKWSVSREYASRGNGANKKIRMHREIMGAPSSAEVDHINGNTLDNRKSNLRVVTHSENMKNRKLNSNSKTGYKGVCYDKLNGMYHVTLRYNGKKVFLGRYKNVVDAALAYNRGALEYFGEFARLNEIDSSPAVT